MRTLKRIFMTLTRKLKEKMHSLALDLNVPDKVVEDMFRSQFDFVAEKMKDADKDDSWPIIILLGLGKFIPRRHLLESRSDYHLDEEGNLYRDEG